MSIHVSLAQRQNTWQKGGGFRGGNRGGGNRDGGNRGGGFNRDGKNFQKIIMQNKWILSSKHHTEASIFILFIQPKILKFIYAFRFQ